MSTTNRKRRYTSTNNSQSSPITLKMSKLTEEIGTLSEIQYFKNQLETARKEISNLRQQVKTLGRVLQKDCGELKEILDNYSCPSCRYKNALPETSVDIPTDIDTVSLKPVGIIFTNFPEKRGTPRQTSICSETVAKLVLNKDVFTNPEHALEGLIEFSHIWILYHFHKNDSTHVRAKISPPRLNGLRTGIFASRSPNRPAPIGLSLVKLERVEDCTIYFSGVDMIDATPVLDIKPYIPQYDSPSLVFNIPSPELNANRRLEGCEMMEENASSNIPDISPQSMSPRFESLNADNHLEEREAPDGEEGEYQVSSSSTSTSTVRVPSWIDQPPVTQLTVEFNERATAQIQELMHERSEQIKSLIVNILKEDPRSVYLRTRWGNQFYTFRIAEVHVSCKFDDVSHTVTVFQIRNAESMEDNS